MERRKEPRVETDEQVIITVLSDPDSAPFEASALDISGSGMRILSPRPVRYQAALKVETRDLLLLGEVIRVEVCDRGHLVALHLQHSLDAIVDLRRLHRELRWEQNSSPGEPALARKIA